jgi:citrate/tricarballylate utilization protein
MQTDFIEEARRQVEICNACRYCEGYCSVFPAMHADRTFSDGDITQLANLCHNCRGCYYACQYTAPHEFDLNLPNALANVRRASWEDYAWPAGFAKLFQRSGTAIAAIAVLGFAALFAAMHALGQQDGEGFYAILSHAAMVAIFLPAFLLPLLSVGIGVSRYWRAIGGGRLHLKDFATAFSKAGKMKDLAAGHGEGCNFEDEDRFSHARRYAHQLVMYGFLLCFASTASGTVMHYLFDLYAPYPLWSFPKLFGVSGGLLMTYGAAWMVMLKLKSDSELGASGSWAGEMGFVLLLGFVGLSGLALYAFGQTAAMPTLLALHLGGVLAFFLITPFSKMAHGFYRLAALLRDANRLNSE